MRLLLILVALAGLWPAPLVLADTTLAPSASTTQINIDNYAFKPATVTIPAGASVTWKNLDDDPHTATADNGAFDSKGLAQGDTFTFRFTKPGTYDYHCSVHPFMKATIVVQASSSDAALHEEAR
jgi:plastocyanin